MKQRLTIIALAVLGVFSGVAAQVSMGGAIGSTSIDGEIWNQVSFRPEIPIGPAGIGLDIPLFINSQGEIRKDDWDFKHDPFNTLMDKVSYFRINQPDDNWYFRGGTLTNLSLGYGILVNQYSNALEYPAVRQLGVHGKMSFAGFQVEAFASDLKMPDILGARVSYCPFWKITVAASIVTDLNQYNGLKDRDGDGVPDEMDMFQDDKQYSMDSDGDGYADNDIQNELDIDGDGIFDQLENGEKLSEFWAGIENLTGSVLSDSIKSLIPDRSIEEMPIPFNIGTADANSFTAVALDASVPFDLPVGTLKIYSQIAKFLGQEGLNADFSTGWGATPGGILYQMPFLQANLEYRYFGKYFVSGYFNTTYDLNRVRIVRDANDSLHIETRDQFYLNNDAVHGMFGSLQGNILNFIELGGQYQYMIGDADTLQSLLLFAQLPEGIIPRLSQARIYYQRDNTPDLLKFKPDENTIWGYNVDVNVSEGVILRAKYQQSYLDVNGDGTIQGKDETAVLTSIETVFSF